MSSWRVDYDSWPWNGHREQAREDARRDHKDRDLYDPYDGDHKRVYAEEFDRETRRIEDHRREEEERQERQAHESAMERRRQEEYEREMVEQERQREEQEQEPEPEPETPHALPGSGGADG